MGVRADLTEPADISALVENASSEFGGIDDLVKNAGGPPSGPFLDMQVEDWYHSFDLLVVSVVRLIREAHSYLLEDGGSIVNITSMTVKEVADSLVLSNSVRMSVIGLQMTLSKEFAPDIRVNAVLPGSHETARMGELIEQGIDQEDC